MKYWEGNSTDKNNDSWNHCSSAFSVKPEEERCAATKKTKTSVGCAAHELNVDMRSGGYIMMSYHTQQAGNNMMFHEPCLARIHNLGGGGR
jgi:hypothetical protein